MFKWDGSEISDIICDERTVIREGVFEKNKYWHIVNPLRMVNEYCIVRSAPSILPCLIDELKPIFNIEKIGTHWIEYNYRKLILLRINYENNVIKQDLTLDKLAYREDLRWEVQKIFIFREILGLTKSWEKSIVLREIGNFIRPLSFYEPNMLPGSEEKVVPNNVLDKWFQEMSLDDGVKKLFNIEKMENIVELIQEIRDKMHPIVLRVERTGITYIDEILSRIRSRLQFILM